MPVFSSGCRSATRILYSRTEEEVNTNVLAPIHLSQLFLKLSALNTIINVTSGLDFSPLSRLPVYSATQAFFHSFTLSLCYQLRDGRVEVIEMIPPALNTDLGGKGLHEAYPPVGEFVASIFEHSKEEKQTLTFGFSDQMAKASAEQLEKAFRRMNP